MKRQGVLASAIVLGLVCGCGVDESVKPVATEKRYAGTLSAELRGTAEVSLSVASDGALKATLSFDEAGAGDVLDIATPLAMEGRLEAFAENQSELYAAKASLPAFAKGPCGAEPMSLALALHRREQNARVGGSLAIYCGQGRFSGVPAKILRLSGELPPS